MNQVSATETFDKLLRVGFPRDGVIKQIQAHIMALENLPSSTEGKDDALTTMRSYLREIEDGA